MNVIYVQFMLFITSRETENSGCYIMKTVKPLTLPVFTQIQQLNY